MSRFRRWVRDAIATHPARDGRPIRVIRRAPKDGSLGEVSRGARVWTVLIDPRLPDLMAWWVFCHEKAHIDAWDDADPVDHSDCGDADCSHWGCWFARGWREWHHDGDHWL